MPEIQPIRKVKAKQFDKKELGGFTIPLRILGNDNQTYVVKLIDSERMSPETYFRELAVSRLAKALLLKTPEPVEFEISGEFAELYKVQDFYSRLKGSVGSNFATKVVRGADVNPSLLHSYKHLRRQMGNVYAFDGFTFNADRKTSRSNCIFAQDDFWLIDHEYAFAFLIYTGPLSLNPVNPLQKELKSHLFYNELKKEMADFEILCERAAKLPQTFWDEVLDQTPESWKNDKVFSQMPAIKSWFSTISSNPLELAKNLKEALS